MNDFTYKFAAVRSSQAREVFYQATVPFRALASVLKIDDHHDPKQRSQRTVNVSRARKVSKYIKQNKENNSFYVMPPLIGFVEGDCNFIEVPLDGFSNIGHLHFPLESKLVLFDGQHRAYGIRELMAKMPEVREENISIMLYPRLSLEQRQQGFHDINFNGSKPSKALCATYNSRNDFERMVVTAVGESMIAPHIEYEKNNAGGNDRKIWSLKAVIDMAKEIFGGVEFENAQPCLTEFLDTLIESTPILSALVYPDREPKDYRCMYVCGHSVTAVALGITYKKLVSEYGEDWKDHISKLNDTPFWYRDSGVFEGACEVNGRMKASKSAAKLTAYRLLDKCGYKPTDMELAEINKLNEKV